MQWIDLPFQCWDISPHRGLKIEQGRKAWGEPRLGGSVYLSIYSSMHAALCRPCRKASFRLDVFSGGWGGGCEFISAPLAVTNKSGGDFSPLHVWQRRKRWMHTVNISHSWFKMTWHRHLFSPCYRPTGSITACVMSVASALAYIQCTRLGKAQPHPRAAKNSCWDGCCTDKSQQGGFDFYYSQSQASVRLLQSPAAPINEGWSPNTRHLTWLVVWMSVVRRVQTSYFSSEWGVMLLLMGHGDTPLHPPTILSSLLSSSHLTHHHTHWVSHRDLQPGREPGPHWALHVSSCTQLWPIRGL